MKNKFETNIEKRDDTIFSIIPVEHLVMNSIDRLGDYLLVYVPFILFEDYQTAVELNDDEKELIDILASKQELIEILNNLQYCTLFIQRKLVNKDVEQMVFNVERACDFLAITQYRYDRKEWSISKPGAIGTYLMAFNINIVTGNIEILYHEKHFFNEIPGIGLEVSYSPLSKNNDFYPIIFMNRTDEVYMMCRYYITKACRTFTIPSLQSTFSELFATLEGIGMIGCSQFANFTKENKRIMAVNSDNQKKYEEKLDVFCFYSEVLRTLVLHQGHSLLEFMDRKSTFRLLMNIFWESITFAKNLINTGIYTLCDINMYIEEKMNSFSDHISSINTSFVLKNEEKGIEGDRESRLVTAVETMLGDDLIRQNKDVAFVLFKGEYQMNQFDTTIDSWQYIDDICGEIQNMLVPLFIEKDALPTRNNCFGAVGVYNGIRGGFIYDSAYDEMVSICGRVYSLINSTESPFLLDDEKVDKEIIDIICSEKRKDEVALGCKSVLSIQ